MRKLASLHRTLVWLTLIATLAAPVLASPVDTTSTETEAAIESGHEASASVSATLAKADAAQADESAAAAQTAAERAESAAAGLENAAAVTEGAADALETTTAIIEQQLEAGETVGGLFRSPAFQVSLVGLLASAVGGIISYFTTNGLKLSTELRGKKTQLLALLSAGVAAGVPAYFGMSQVPGIDGWEGVALALVPTLLAFGEAVGIHETREFARTGMRKPERKRAKAEGRLPVNRLFSPQLDTQLENVIEGVAETALAYALPPPVAALIADSFGPVVLEAAETALKRPLDKAERLELLEARKAAISAGVAEQVEAARPKKPGPKPDEKVKLTRPAAVPSQPHVTPAPSENAQEQEI